MAIYLDTLFPTYSSGVIKKRANNPNASFNLTPGGVYMCHFCYQTCGELLPPLSILTLSKDKAVYFCCTFLKVTFTGISPALCPVVLGLSSLGYPTATVWLSPCQYNTFFIFCQVKLQTVQAEAIK